MTFRDAASALHFDTNPLGLRGGEAHPAFGVIAGRGMARGEPEVDVLEEHAPDASSAARTLAPAPATEPSATPGWPVPLNAFGMVGLEQVSRSLLELVHYSLATGKRFPDRLLVGPAGVGKSTLARALSHRLVEGGCVLVNGADCRTPDAFIKELGENGLLQDNDGNRILVEPAVILIDEAHALTRVMKNWLLSVTDDERAANADGHLYVFKRVTILLATTDPGRLSAAMQSRFEALYLRAYTLNELAGIVWLHANRALDGHSLSQAACAEVAARMRAQTRRAVRALTLTLIPHAFTALGGTQDAPASPTDIGTWLTADNIARYYDSQGIDRNGIDGKSRALLAYLKTHGTVPEKRLRQGLGLTTQADFDEIDEYLCRLGLIAIDSRGRSLTALGARYRPEDPPCLRFRIDGAATTDALA